MRATVFVARHGMKTALIQTRLVAWGKYFKRNLNAIKLKSDENIRVFQVRAY